MSGFKREYTDPKEVAKDKSGFSLSAGKDSVGITFTKKLGGKKKKKKKYD